MKIKMPEFEKFDIDSRVVNPDDIVPEFYIEHPYFEGHICVDGPSDTGAYFMYGYIGGSYYYGDSVAASDDIDLEETKDGMIKTSSMRKAYKTIVKQLKERYRKWVIENLME